MITLCYQLKSSLWVYSQVGHVQAYFIQQTAHYWLIVRKRHLSSIFNSYQLLLFMHFYWFREYKFIDHDKMIFRIPKEAAKISRDKPKQTLCQLLCLIRTSLSHRLLKQVRIFILNNGINIVIIQNLLPASQLSCLCFGIPPLPFSARIDFFQEDVNSCQINATCDCGGLGKKIWFNTFLSPSVILVHQCNIRYQKQLLSKMLSFLLRNRCFAFSKICNSPQEAIKGVKDGSLLLVGGFGICGVPMNLINAVKESGVKNLTIASNNCGVGDKEGKADWGLAVLLRNRQIRRMISSYVGENVEFERQFFNGELELEICPQGTLAEKIRSGGAGIPAFYTATGVDTIIEKGGFPIKYKVDSQGKLVLDQKGQKVAEIISSPKPTAVFEGRKYLMQKSIFGDFALVKAKRADKMGNLQFQKTERNFNADMATAAKCVIAEVQEIVENGELDPESIHTPAVYVDRVFKSDPQSPFSEKFIEKLTVSDHDEVKKMTKQSDLQKGNVLFNDGKISGSSKDHLRLKIVRRAAKEVKDGMNVNLGIGIPTLLPSVLPQDVKIHLQSENGIMGVGPYPRSHQVNANNINAGKQTITLLPGGSYFSSSQSFSIIRGGHLDVTMLGALQISKTCDIANWIIPGKMMKGMGGAMDLVACGSKVIVLMEHSAKTKDGKISLKLIENCKLPLTAKGVVSMVITEKAVFENRGGVLVLTEIAEDTTVEQVQKNTGFELICAETLGRF